MRGSFPSVAALVASGYALQVLMKHSSQPVRSRKKKVGECSAEAAAVLLELFCLCFSELTFGLFPFFFFFFLALALLLLAAVATQTGTLMSLDGD